MKTQIGIFISIFFSVGVNRRGPYWMAALRQLRLFRSLALETKLYCPGFCFQGNLSKVRRRAETLLSAAWSVLWNNKLLITSRNSRLCRWRTLSNESRKNRCKLVASLLDVCVFVYSGANLFSVATLTVSIFLKVLLKFEGKFTPSNSFFIFSPLNYFVPPQRSRGNWTGVLSN